MIELRCPSCGQALETSDGLAGMPGLGRTVGTPTLCRDRSEGTKR